MKIISMILLNFLLCQNIFSQTFTQLRGFEDQNGNTHLFYEIYQYYQSGGSSNILHHWDMENNIDTIFFWGYFDPILTEEEIMVSYDFMSLNPDKYLYCITSGFWHYLYRSDCQVHKYSLWGDPIDHINISKLDTSIVVASAVGVLKSADGGFNWTSAADFEPLAVSPYNDSILIGRYYFFDPISIIKSTDRGESFYVVDTTYAIVEAFFDQDKKHIYAINAQYDPVNIYRLLVSDNSGEPFTWLMKQEYSGKIKFNFDPQTSGKIYIANDKSLYQSLDYGDNFTLLHNFDELIIDIYNKPGTEKIFIATKYHIYELENDSLLILKDLNSSEVSDEFLSDYEFSLFQNYPNPFNPITTIQYQLGKKGFVTLKVYDIMGKEIETLVNEEKSAGNYFIKFNGSKLSSGVYIYHLTADSFSDSKKFILMK